MGTKGVRTKTGTDSELPAWVFSSLLGPREQGRQSFCRILLDRLASQIPWDFAAFLLGDQSGEFQVTDSFAKKGEIPWRNPQVELHLPAVRRVLLQARPLLVEDLPSDPSFRAHPRALNQGIRALLVVPCTFQGKVSGAIYLHSRSRRFRASPPRVEALVQAGRLFATWTALQERLSRTGRDQHLLDLGRQSASLLHDLRNLFSLIQGRVQWTRTKSKVAEAPLLEMENELLLGKARLEELLCRGLGSDRGEVDVGDLLAAACARIPFLRVGAERISLTQEEGRSFRVRGNRAALTDAFTNLLLNAVDATLWGGDVAVSLYREGPEIFVRVSDHGVGMDKGQMDQLFEPFSCSRKEGSVGVGLFATRRIVESHGGKLRVLSAPRIGTSVVLSFPALPELGARLRILILDDEESEFFPIREAFVNLSCHLEFVQEEKEAIARLRESRYDLFVVDYGMPRRDGLEIIQDLRARGVRTPAILLAAGRVSVSKDLPGIRIEIKPVRVRHLRRLAEELLR